MKEFDETFWPPKNRDKYIFVTSKLLGKEIHLPREMKKIEVLDHVIRHNGTLGYGQAANDLRVNQRMSRTPGGADRMPHIPYANDL